MITKEFLASCTDEQINHGVAWLEAASFDIKDMRCSIMVSRVSKRVIRNSSLFKPCERPNDIMPIAFANGISLHSDDEYDIDGNLVKQWVAYNGSEWRNVEYKKERMWSTNPLRSICEVYILMSLNK